MNDLITIGLPVFNVEKYIEKALLTALNQTYDNLEYIIVDDKGSDRSMEIVRSIMATHHRGKNVRIIEHTVNIGTGAARNTILDAATGKYLFFMDSDDEITPDCIEKLYAKMLTDDVDIVIGSYKKLLRTGETIEDCINKNSCICGHFEVAWQYFEKRNQSMPATCWNKLYKTSFLREKQIYCIPNHLPEDSVFSFQSYLNASSCSFVPQITYLYYVVSGINKNEAKNEEVSFRMRQQFAEIISFELKYAQNYRQERIYESLLSFIVSFIFFLPERIKYSNLTVPKKGKELLKEIPTFPLTLKEILQLRRKKSFFIISYLLFKMPCRMFILQILKLKKIVSVK
jgi:glycosyltransferase involved in cell wall biosynthesis